MWLIAKFNQHDAYQEGQQQILSICLVYKWQSPYPEENRGCFTYNLNPAHLKDCSEHKGRPVCRSLSQINYFTPGQDVTMIRECAYVYTEPLKCEQSKFSNIHYSRVCECT
uniref:SFRICE_000236 n=1 Tax=Spodoptera frugiperda TaxID=7108 RepID=A0A2H1VN24_SPOFR